jgi:hypothetical protein
MMAVPIIGCSSGSRTYPVHGRVVTTDGVPVKSGVVEFRATKNALHARGTLDANGNFQLTTYRSNDGAIAGEHQVVVVQVILATIGGVEVVHVHDHGPSIDPKYSDYSKSGLTADVQPTAENRILLVVDRQHLE